MPDFDVALLTVGEETGRLDVSFKMLAKFYTDRAKIIRDTITSLILPMLNLTVLLLVFPLSFLVAFALGIINGDYRFCIPFLVEKTLVYGLLYGTIFFLIFACQGTHGERWRSLVERIVRLMPMLRTAVKFLVLGRFTAALEALVNAGVPVIRSWEMAARASGSPRLKREIAARIEQLEHGMTPAEMVNAIGYFPDMFRNLYYTGEISGQIDDTLMRLRDYYQEEGIRKLQLFTNIMSKVIYGVIALTIAINVIRFYLGYFGGIAQQIDSF
jgi:type II secretory pathway component PulF